MENIEGYRMVATVTSATIFTSGKGNLKRAGFMYAINDKGEYNIIRFAVELNND
ncbi:hypothetical protein [Chryseobacterium luquanense]|uniref:Uncharacterized protein n=1 Tax=Chryseobacterium luquanense TaxID=2983766 RepID=A0ABT3Y7P4_9FLAO|nr:hypothetical protein [Chryseobacterium luquanense]MCX8534191.1 hypothetical protein [Chryseobacterium luquanense]